MIGRRAGLAALIAAVVTGSVLVAAPGPVAATTAQGASTYSAITPTRLLDTRKGTGEPGAVAAPIPGDGSISLKVVDGTLIPAGATAVALNLTAVVTRGFGYLSAYPHGASVPDVSTLNFLTGQTVANLVVVKVGTGGAIDLYNGSASPIDALADVSGYFLPSQTSNPQGAYVPLPAPERALDTRPNDTLAGGATTSLSLTDHGVPSGVSAVVLNLTAVSPAESGYLAAYAEGGKLPATSSVNFAPKQDVANLVVVPVSAAGGVDIYNGSHGRVDVLVDISGYVYGGDPLASGTLGALAPARLLDTRFGVGAPKARVAPGGAVTLTVAGHGGVPLTGVSAVVLEVTAVTAGAPGFVTAYADGTQRPTVSNLNLIPGKTAANLVFAPVGTDGKVVLYNGSATGTIDLVADVSGYVLDLGPGRSLPVPATSTSRYVRNITGAASDVTTMTAEGRADAAAGSTLVVLDIGAQLNNESGVQLSATPMNLTYAQLVTAVQAYLGGFGSVSGATVAVATNNEGDFTAYPASARGADWANHVIDQLSPAAGVAVVGANDIEPGFASTEAQAEQWEAAFLANTSRNLIFAGSADGCPTSYGVLDGTCGYGWTEAQLANLAGASNSRIRALPQIYLADQAVQWANIEATGGGSLTFAGALTENAACPSASEPGCTFAALPPAQGWAALYHAVSTVVSTPSLPALTDLQVDS